MKTTLRSFCNWSPRVLLAAMVLFGLSLFAQAPSAADDSTSAQQQTSDKDKKTASAKKGEQIVQQPDLGIAVDSARKSDALSTWITSEHNEGEIGGPWVVKQSAEFGGRISDFTGNPATWSSFVNLGTGPRLLEYSLDMHSPTHTGVLFDDFLFTNFGYGGDPNNVSRIRAQKGRIYSFNAAFRRDQNIFDYDLFANPLNPSASNPNVPILQSPHEFLLTRRMSDVNLNLFPVGSVRVRLGWSRVVNEGTSFSSDHQGTEALLLQPTLNTTDNYNFGVSLRVIPRTSLNYDQFYTFFKGDTSASLTPATITPVFGLPPFFLASGTPVQLGLPFNTAAGQPCATPILGTGFVNPACNGFISYLRLGRTRNSFPTEQFSFQSNYFRRLDFAGRINYSDAEADMPATVELFNGLVTRNRVRSSALTGSSIAHRLSLAGDFGVTFHVTDKLRIVDNFRYDNFRIPGSWSLATANLFGATLLSNPNLFSPATCPPPFTAATCPQHNTSSPADLIADQLTEFLRQERRINTFLVEYDFTRRITAHVGYRFERREITHTIGDSQDLIFFPTLATRGACAGQPVDAQGVCTTSTDDFDTDTTLIYGHTGLIGFAARPTDNFRISADAEFLSADNTFTRIGPRHLQDYRIRANYKPESWVTVGAAVRILESRNPSLDIGNFQHNRSYGFSANFAPEEAKFGVDLSYDYNDVFSQTNICFVATPTPPGAITCGTPFLSGTSLYTNLSHFFSGMAVVKPWKRVTGGLGYAVTSTSGNTLILNPNAPTGPLNFNYHLPTASLAIELSKNLIYKTGWNYYDYNEKTTIGPTLPRDFRGNVFTLSLRYSM